MRRKGTANIAYMQIFLIFFLHNSEKSYIFAVINVNLYYTIKILV